MESGYVEDGEGDRRMTLRWI